MEFLQSQPGQEPVTLSGTFAASASRLFRAWTTPEELMQWFGSSANSLLSADVDLHEGGQWRFVVGDSPEKKSVLQGTYLEILTDAKLVFSWCHVLEFSDGSIEATPLSQVTVLFTELAAGTRIDLCHEKIRAEDGRLGVGRGWSSSFEQLSHHCAGSDMEV